MPTAKSLAGPVPPLDPVNLDHFKCYKVSVKKRVCLKDPNVKCKTDSQCVEAGVGGKCNLGFQKRQVTLDDQFPDPVRLLDVVKPTRLCTPVNKDSEGIKNLNAHLMCYKVKPAKGEPKHVKIKGIHVNNQFGLEELDTMREEELCVPSVKTVP